MAKSRRPFSGVIINNTPLWELATSPAQGGGFETVVRVLDFVHIEAGLLSAYRKDYPLVEPRELIPSFDAPLIEYERLPAFSMLALGREISYQDEGFQFDMLLPEGRPPDPGLAAANRQILRERLPRDQVPALERDLGRKAATHFARYTLMLPHLFKMDRGHVIAKSPKGAYLLAGVYASFPSDLDGEIKRFGNKLGKFKKGDNRTYRRNRLFVYRFMMEQLGFPICGERHTSAALFARRLMRRRELFAVKVLGHSDRTITTLTSLGARGGLPRVEKTALVQAKGCSFDGERALKDGGFFVDAGRRVVILKVHYQQHAHHPGNVLEDRALSVLRQEVIHPQTGEAVELDVLGLSRDRLLLLNDIVRGEHQGSIVYQGNEPVTGTRDMANRLKFLAAWISKHRHILADYSPDTFGRVLKVVSSFLGDSQLAPEFDKAPELHAECKRLLTEVRLAHRLRLLEKLVANMSDASGRKLHHVHVLIILVHILSQEGEELGLMHPWALGKLLAICHTEMEKPYLKKRYLSGEPTTKLERQVMGEYRLLEKLIERHQHLARV